MRYANDNDAERKKPMEKEKFVWYSEKKREKEQKNAEKISGNQIKWNT